MRPLRVLVAAALWWTRAPALTSLSVEAKPAK